MKKDAVAHTKRSMAAWLLVVGLLTVGSASLVTDPTGAHLELAPVFVGVALGVASVWLFRSRSRRNRG